MLVKNKSGDIEAMRYGPANDAVEAGTHTFVNVDDDGKPKAEKSKGKSKSGEGK